VTQYSEVRQVRGRSSLLGSRAQSLSGSEGSPRYFRRLFGGWGEARKIKELERELLRKERALAEVAALLALKKKADAIWGDGDDDTDTRIGT